MDGGSRLATEIATTPKQVLLFTSMAMAVTGATYEAVVAVQAGAEAAEAVAEVDAQVEAAEQISAK